jgi:hypothetical protein
MPVLLKLFISLLAMAIFSGYLWWHAPRSHPGEHSMLVMFTMTLLGSLISGLAYLWIYL